MGAELAGGLGGRSGKAQLQWGGERERLAAALARAPAREAPARVHPYIPASTARSAPFSFVPSAVRAGGVPWGARGAPSASAGRRRALVAVTASNDV